MDTGQRELRRNGQVVSIQPKSFTVLEYLVERADRMVTKTELLDAFWPPNVSEAALLTTISQIRKALGDTGKGSVLLKTYHGQGFRFVAQINAAESAPRRSHALNLREHRIVAVLCVRFGDGDASARDSFIAFAKAQVEAHQGRLMHMMVDDFTAGFGLEDAYEDSARRALYCAAALAPRANPLPLSFAIAAGSVALEEGGSAWAPPNYLEAAATRMAKAARSGDILLTSDVQAHLQGDAVIEAVPDGFRVVSISQHRAGIPARASASSTRFFGRRAELAFMRAAADTMRDGNGQALVLLGPAGIGKSRLTAEFLRGLEDAHLSCYKIQCLPGLNNTPLAPIRALCLLLQDAGASVEFGDDIDAALWRELLEDTGKRAPELRDLTERARRQRLFAMVDQMVHRASAVKPLLLVFEDVHWIDATSREYLDTLIRTIDRHCVLLVLTTRPTDALPLSEAVVQLSPLNAADSLDLLRESGDLSGIDGLDVNLLVQRAGGNPFFLEELALAARLGGDPAKDLPSTVQAVISVRIAGLARQERAIVYVMAVIGVPCGADLVAGVTGDTVADTENVLRRLIAQGFLVDDSGGFVFRHMLIQDTAYSLIADADRRALHQKIADLFGQEGSPHTARPETLAWHHQEAGNSEAAIAHWIAACRAAVSRSANREAREFALNGLALIDPENPDHAQAELNLQLSLVFVYTELHGYAARAVGDALYRARALNKSVGTPETNVRVTVGLWVHTWVSGALQDSISYAGDLIRIAQVAGSPALSTQANASMGEVLVHTGQLDQALGYLTTGLAFLDDTPPESIPAQSAATACASYAAWAASLSGRYELAAKHHATSKTLSARLENPFARALHNALGSEHRMFEGDVAGCLDLADRAVEISRQHDFAFWLGTGLVMRGWALGCRGDMQAAFDALDEGIDVFTATGAGVQMANWYGLKAEVLLRADQPAEALEAARHALDCAEKTGDVFFTPRIHAVMSQAQNRLGDSAAAQMHSKTAHDLARDFAMTLRMLETGL